MYDSFRRHIAFPIFSVRTLYSKQGNKSPPDLGNRDGGMITDEKPNYREHHWGAYKGIHSPSIPLTISLGHHEDEHIIYSTHTFQPKLVVSRYNTLVGEIV